MRRGLETVCRRVLPIALLGAAACSSGPESAPATSSSSAESSVTTQTGPAATEQTLPRTSSTTRADESVALSEAEVRQRRAELTMNGLAEVARSFREQKVLPVRKGLCLAWENQGGGVQITINPVWYTIITNTEHYSFSVFMRDKRGDVTKPAPPEGPDVANITFFKGIEHYAGKIQNNSPEDVVIFASTYEEYAGDLDPKSITPELVSVSPVLYQYRDGHWALEELESGEEIGRSVFFADAELDDFQTLCQRAGLTYKLRA